MDLRWRINEIVSWNHYFIMIICVSNGYSQTLSLSVISKYVWNGAAIFPYFAELYLLACYIASIYGSKISYQSFCTLCLDQSVCHRNKTVTFLDIWKWISFFLNTALLAEWPGATFTNKVRAWINSYIDCSTWDTIAHPCFNDSNGLTKPPLFNLTAIEVTAWMSNYTLHGM